jgi:tetratricopeptide (TPR) repeat protein
MRLFALTKETDKFDESLRACVSLDNRNLDVYSEALLFFQNLRDWDMCLYWSWRGRMRLPESSLFPAMEGFAYLQKGELRKARASAEEAVRRDPTMGWYHCILGWILVEQGDLDGAKRAIEKGIALRTGVSNPGFFRSLLKKK